MAYILFEVSFFQSHVVRNKAVFTCIKTMIFFFFFAISFKATLIYLFVCFCNVVNEFWSLYIFDSWNLKSSNRSTFQSCVNRSLTLKSVEWIFKLSISCLTGIWNFNFVFNRYVTYSTLFKSHKFIRHKIECLGF